MEPGDLQPEGEFVSAAIPPDKIKNNKILILFGMALVFAVACLVIFIKSQNIVLNRLRTKTVCDTFPQQAVTAGEDESVDKYPSQDCTFQVPKGMTIRELDTTSCSRISFYFIVDKNHVYKQLYDPGSSNTASYVIIEEADPATFSHLGSNYYKDINRIYFDAGMDYTIINDVDVNTVQVVSFYFLKDKNHLYYYQYNNDGDNEIITQNIFSDFDAGTFTVIDNELNPQFYFKDKNGIYFRERYGKSGLDLTRIDGADPDTFMALPHYLLAKDKNHVFYQGKIIESLDANTFEVLDGSYFRDINSIYVRHQETFTPLANSDPCSFVIIDYRDQYQWGGYAKDKYQVYYRGYIVEGADPDTFQVKERKDGIGGAFDKNYEYQGTHRKEDLK